MRHFLKPNPVSLLLALLIIVSSAACGPASAPTAAPATNTAVLPTAVSTTAAPAPSATPMPSATPVPPTATAVPTATLARPTSTPTPAPTQAAVQGSGLGAWCLPEEVSVTALQKPLEPPAEALVGEIVDGALEVRNLPASACVITYTFDQPAPEGLKMQVYEQRAKTPWLTAELRPIEGKPEMVMAIVKHTYIVAPPLWDVSYTFTVVDAAGSEVRRDLVNLHRWTPTLCWNGRPPNPLTLRCPLPQDLHPWDPSYGTPIPTFPPEDDD